MTPSKEIAQETAPLGDVRPWEMELPPEVVNRLEITWYKAQIYAFKRVLDWDREYVKYLWQREQTPMVSAEIEHTMRTLYAVQETLKVFEAELESILQEE